MRLEPFPRLETRRSEAYETFCIPTRRVNRRCNNCTDPVPDDFEFFTPEELAHRLSHALNE